MATQPKVGIIKGKGLDGGDAETMSRARARTDVAAFLAGKFSNRERDVGWVDVNAVRLGT
jgi:hypothetical protein